ncbi:Polyketide cyclase / dehydrase and lipid transport [Lacunisphaera limnophila]|uniref:Polyketide cyclase / dehydrase and lipid transport n=1 Tax=Lacunisphaera limnophila TaxID=1838286 RepID=A0A1I7PHN9_9BACT|nr:SRPBCC family protein [Lacunisphaera limnophila]AOS43128.1 Polyketide cyclase / dehydrase and lipid transport [Lacunisphaera limnophila]
MLPVLLALLAVLVIGFLLFVASRPGTFRYTRCLVIAAPPAALFAQVDDLRKFQDWNPWAKLDPQCVFTYGGPATGTGATYHWKGNRKVGEGRMTITESRPPALVRSRLEFIKPFAATHTGEFTFTPEAGGTRVSWTMTGENNFMSKFMGVFMNFEQMIGRDFDQGLATLKALTEHPPSSAS